MCGQIFSKCCRLKFSLFPVGNFSEPSAGIEPTTHPSWMVKKYFFTLPGTMVGEMYGGGKCIHFRPSLFSCLLIYHLILKKHIFVEKLKKRWVRTHKYNEINDSEWLVNQRHAKTKHIFAVKREQNKLITIKGIFYLKLLRATMIVIIHFIFKHFA